MSLPTPKKDDASAAITDLAAPDSAEETERAAPDDEPPGPGTWEWSQAYGWVEVASPVERLRAVLAARDGRVYSEQFKQMVEVDADGRVIPPE